MKKGQEWTKETKETEQEEEKKQVARRRQDWPKGEKETEQEGIVCYSRDSSRESYQTVAQEYITTAASGRTES